MKPNWTDYLPVGYSKERMFLSLRLIWCAAALRSFSYLINLGDARSDLFVYRGTNGSAVLREGAVMTDFHVILDGAFSLVPLLIGLLLAMIGALYAYHFQESRSIYLMRRLPQRWELTRRCVTLPLVGIGVLLILCCILFFVYYGLYFAFTPEATLAPHQWGKWLATWM